MTNAVMQSWNNETCPLEENIVFVVYKCFKPLKPCRMVGNSNIGS